MKVVLKIIGGIIGAIYLIVVIILTILLLSYNQYKVSVINGNSLIIIDEKSDKYDAGDLIVFEKVKNSDVVVGDEVFFYEVSNGISTIEYGKVTESKVITETESTFTINNNHDISSESLIGKTDNSKRYADIGKILSILESKYVFLLLVILPTLILFLYELYRLIVEIKTPIEE